MAKPVPFVGDFSDVIVDSATLLVDGTELTVSRGGWAFDPGEEWEDFVFPGRTMNTVGARSLVRVKPVIRGTALLTGEDQITAYRPDGTWADHATIDGARTFTPNALRAYLTDPDYLENVMVLWKRLRGDFIAVEFPFAVCGSWNLGATDGDEGLFQLVIEAVQDNPATGTTKTRLPYRVRKIPRPPDDDGPPEPPPEEPDLGTIIWDLDATNPDLVVLNDGSDYINTWPDASASALDGDPAGAIGQISPRFNVSGMLAVPYPRVSGIITDGVSSASLPTDESFTLYVVGTFAPGWIVRADQGPGNFGLYMEGAAKLQAFVWSTGIDNTLITSASPIGAGPHVIALAFDRTGGHFWMYADDLALGDRACNPQQLDGTTKIRVGFAGGVNTSASYYNRLLMYDQTHDATKIAIVGARLRLQWGL